MHPKMFKPSASTGSSSLLSKWCPRSKAREIIDDHETEKKAKLNKLKKLGGP